MKVLFFLCGLLLQTLVDAFKPFLSSKNKHVRNISIGMLKSISGLFGSSDDLKSGMASSSRSSKVASSIGGNQHFQQQTSSSDSAGAGIFNFIGSAFESVTVMLTPSPTNSQSIVNKSFASEQPSSSVQQSSSGPISNVIGFEKDIFVAGYMDYDPREEASRNFRKVGIINNKQMDGAGSMFVSSPSCTWFMKE